MCPPLPPHILLQKLRDTDLELENSMIRWFHSLGINKTLLRTHLSHVCDIQNTLLGITLDAHNVNFVPIELLSLIEQTFVFNVCHTVLKLAEYF